MSNRYHAASFSHSTGISRYASDFYELVLLSRGYTRLEPHGAMIDSIADEIVARGDEVHVEIGVNETSEIALLYALLRRGCRSVDVTLHDPPFLRWPHFQFRNRHLNAASKVFHLYLRNFGIGTAELRMIRRFFVLTEKGRDAVRHRYGFTNVHYLPFILPVEDIDDPVPSPPNLLFFGFIAANKGLDMALDLHSGVLEKLPSTRFFVVGDAINSVGASYLADLKCRYTTNVEYVGFVEEAELKAIFLQSSVVLLPFREYRSVIPASASVLGAMARGRVVFTTDVNAVAQFVRHGRTGCLLSGSRDKDVLALVDMLSQPVEANRIARGAVDYLRIAHSADVVGKAYDAACAR